MPPRPRDFKIDLSEFNEFIRFIFLRLGLTLFLNAMPKALTNIQAVNWIDTSELLKVMLAGVKEHLNEKRLQGLAASSMKSFSGPSNVYTFIV